MDANNPAQAYNNTKRRLTTATRLLLLALICVALPWATAASAQRCGAPATPIHVIQGDAAQSPLLGAIRTVEAVVTAAPVPATGKPRGFFLQSEPGQEDDNPATAEGLFVFAPKRTDLTVGERVRVTGRVAEFQQRTELSQVRRISRCGEGAVPSPTPLSLADGQWLEPLEGMYVELTDAAVASAAPYRGRLVASAERLYQPTQLVPPGPAAIELATAQAAHRLLVDTRLLHRQHGARLRAGINLAGLRGIIDQHGDDYLLRPTEALPHSIPSSRPAPPPLAGDRQLRVVGFNVENYFNGDGRGGGFPTARGARSLPEFERQQRRIAAALKPLAADIVAIMEVENNGYGRRSAIVDLAENLAAATELPYEIIRPQRPRLGSDAIAVGLLYRRDTVRPIGPPAVLDAVADARFAARNRPALAQTFEQRANGERLTVAVNHFKSKGSSCADLGDPDRDDGQGNCNLTRKRAAQALAEWLRADPTAAGESNQLIIGDLNAYAQEDPIRALRAAGYIDLIAEHLGERAYTYVYDGRAGYLDYALASPGLWPQIAAVHIWHINADEPAATAKSVGPYRSSDHDPVIVDLQLNRQPAQESESQP